MGHDYKDDFKLESARNFLTGNKKMYEHNETKTYDVNTFSEWIKLEYKRLSDSEISLRDAKNKALDIIQQKDIKIDELQCRIDGFRQMLNTLGEHGIYSEEGLQNHFAEIDRLKSIASGQPTQVILNLQESNTRFEKQVSDLTTQVLQLQIENKQLQNINTGLNLLIDEQDEKQKDRALIQHCQAVIDAGNELRIYLDGAE